MIGLMLMALGLALLIGVLAARNLWRSAKRVRLSPEAMKEIEGSGPQRHVTSEPNGTIRILPRRPR